MQPVGGLAALLRARRARLKPGDVGLPAGIGLRRTPGLRREELAALAGVSIDYYIRLEQGRETHPSPAVLDALAAALRLDDEERSHLHAIADHRSRDRTGRRSPTQGRQDTGGKLVRPGIYQLLETVRPCPAYVLSQISDILATNPEGLCLLHGLADWPPERRNNARFVFVHPAARELFVDWYHTAVSTAANLHAVAAADPGTHGLAELLDELNEHSSEFATLWQRFDIRTRRGEPKVFQHPQVGRITLNYETLRLDNHQRISIYQAAPGTPDQDALKLLAMLTADQPAGKGSGSRRPPSTS